MRLQGKRVILTGASGGLGRSIGQRLLDEGAKVVGLDLHPDAGPIQVLEADICNPASVNAAVANSIGLLGGLDVLINNAGINGLEDPGAPPTSMSSRKMEVNFFGTWRVTAAALPALLASRGRVINIASIGAHTIVPFLPSYSASKRAVAAYSDVLRAKYGDHIKVITVYPSYIRTGIHDAEEAQGFWPERVYSMTIGPLKLSGEEPLTAVAKTIARLCSGRAPRNTGVTWRSRICLWSARRWPAVIESMIRKRITLMENAGMRVNLGSSLSETEDKSAQ